MSFADYLETKLIDHAFGGAAFTQPAAWYFKLHLGDPGEAGTANAATETTRKSVTWGASSGGTVTQSGTATWTSYPAGETVSYISIWDAVSAGNCLGSGPLTASKAMQNGDSLAISAATVSLD